MWKETVVTFQFTLTVQVWGLTLLALAMDRQQEISQV